MAQLSFFEIIKQDAAKEALMLTLINPRIGGVIIDGDTGSGKSLLVSGLKDISDMEIKKMPLNISEDRLMGTVDIEKTMEKGDVCIEKGLLEEASEKILFIDDVGLLPDHITDILMSVLTSGEIRCERDGISHEAEAHFILAGTLNSTLQPLRRTFLDCFGLYVRTEKIIDPTERIQIMRACEKKACCSNADLNIRKMNSELKQKIKKAKELVARIIPDDETLRLIVNKCKEYNVEGNRADIIMRETAIAVAAFHGKECIDEDDINEAAFFVLPHRRRESPPVSETPEEKNNKETEEKEDSKGEEKNDHEERNIAENEKINDDKKKTKEQEEDNEADKNNENSNVKWGSVPVAFETGRDFKVIEFGHKKDRTLRSGSGKRTLTKTNSVNGRYIYPTMVRKNNDIALDATIRAAAPKQRFRDKKGMAIALREDDIRGKVRQKKAANLLVFVVDASGSMGAVRRMTEAKGAVLSLLKDAYVKRDKVSMVTFSGEGAGVVLPPTRSTERGYKLLKDIKTGGKTPLNAGIEKGIRVIQNQMRNDPDIFPMLIIITDGRGNVSIDSSKKPTDELFEIGKLLSKGKTGKKIETMVIDTENENMLSFGIAGQLAKAMDAVYYRLEDIKSNEIEAAVRMRVKERL